VLRLLSSGQADEATVESLKKALAAADWGSRKQVICAAQNALALGGQKVAVLAECKPETPKLAAKEAEYKARFANPFVAGARGFIDDVILPHETRKRISRSLVMLRDKKIENPWRKHGNIPL
jgi:acetyl-CoA carboxylase carboxyltransferase component